MKIERGLRAKANLYEDYCGDDRFFEPNMKILESHVDENGVTIIDKVKIIGVDLCQKENEDD